MTDTYLLKFNSYMSLQRDNAGTDEASIALKQYLVTRSNDVIETIGSLRADQAMVDRSLGRPWTSTAQILLKAQSLQNDINEGTLFLLGARSLDADYQQKLAASVYAVQSTCVGRSIAVNQ